MLAMVTCWHGAMLTMIPGYPRCPWHHGTHGTTVQMVPMVIREPRYYGTKETMVYHDRIGIMRQCQQGCMAPLKIPGNCQCQGGRTGLFVVWHRWVSTIETACLAWVGSCWPKFGLEGSMGVYGTCDNDAIAFSLNCLTLQGA